MREMTFRCIPQENMSGRYCMPHSSDTILVPVRCQTERRPSMHTNPNPNPCPRIQCNMPPEQNICPSLSYMQRKQEIKKGK